MKRSLFLAILLLPLLGCKERTEINVPCDVPTLEEACRKISENGTIRLAPGEHLALETVTITKNVTILGDEENPESVVIQGGERNAFRILAGTVELAG